MKKYCNFQQVLYDLIYVVLRNEGFETHSPTV